MSDKEKQQYQGIPPEWAGQMPPPGYLSSPGNYGFPPFNPMMPPGYMHHLMGPGMAQYHAQMHEMAKQHAQAMQQQAAQYQAMMAGQQGINPQSGPPPEMNPNAGPQAGYQANPFAGDPMMEQAQAMLEGALGEEDAGMFKELLGTLGMNDKEFWKGALVGAAAALILSNENVRKGLMGLVSGTGDMLKCGGESVKETAKSTASAVKDNVTAGSEIFRDTYQAGKEGFKDSVDRHKAPPTADEGAEGADPEADIGANI